MRILSLILLLFALTACNTIKGAGRDITAGGQALDNAL